VRVWESKLASFGFMGVKFWLQNLHAQFTERSVPVIFSSMQKSGNRVRKQEIRLETRQKSRNRTEIRLEINRNQIRNQEIRFEIA
jgi:hypothetical protein